MKTPKPSKILKWSLIIGLVIVLNLFYNYTLSLVFSSPSYESFCPQKQVNLAPENQDQCVSSGGAWTEYPTNLEQAKVAYPDKTVPAKVSATGYCDATYTCNANYQSAEKNYEKNVFIALVVIGVLTFVAGLLLLKFEVMSIALSLGAVLDFIIASIRYWSQADELFKVLILGVALVVLIWIAIKKFNVTKEGENETEN